MGIKKTFLSLASAFFLITSSILTVSCSANQSGTGFDEKEQKYKYYELDGMKFASKEDAISYALTEGSEKEDFKIQKNQVYFGENQYGTVEEVYSKIEKDYNIKTKVINKNPNDYIIDANGEVDSLITNSQERGTKIYRNADGTISSDLNEQNAYQNALQSHYNLIKKNYLADGQKFATKDATLNYYNSKYKSSNDFQIGSCYQFSQKCLSENELKNELANSAEANYEYNGEVISGFDLYNPNKINPTLEDSSAISRVDSRPGLYYVEQIPGTEGRVTGQSMVEYTSDLKTLISNSKNWDLVSKSNTGLADKAMSWVFEKQLLLSMHAISSIIDIAKMAMGIIPVYEPPAGFMETPTHKFDLKETVIKFVNPHDKIEGYNDYLLLQDIIDKYQISGHWQSQVNQLNSLDTMEFDIKEKIALMKLRDLIRETDITREDSETFNRVYWKMLYNFDVLDEWYDLVYEIPESMAPDFIDCIVNPSEENLIIFNETFNKNSFKTKAERYFEAWNHTIETILKNLTQLIPLVNKLFPESRIVTGFLAGVGKAVPVIQLVLISIQVLNMIPVQTTFTYQLIIPTNRDKITYEVTKAFWKKHTFKPENIFNVFEIRKPQTVDRFLIFNRYYNSYDSAEKYLKETILEDLRRKDADFYTTKFNQNKKYSSKDELVENNFKEYEKNELKLYSDKFGKNFNSQEEAFNSYINNLNNNKFIEEYYYQNGSKSEVYYADNEEDVKNYIRDNIEIESKFVDWTDMFFENSYDSIIDINEAKYLAYSVKVKGVTHYFADLNDLYNFVMIEENYQNRFYYEIETSYTYKDMEFASQEEFLNYLLDEIKVVYTNDTFDRKMENKNYAI
ncbi:hypothetical protein [Spiroplasma alleghenense]|uniref:Lipoprotein n=1 Tax=Spiroplasma alleghenense TaxID=216931 RepID=A0A345Z2H1_9MOLU|nr:hypothetical protein [Spiroplasma alleghenense]AXK50800.1 hypothetical protein SALLE_v1c01240 [Spiroplasma alleghenense]